MINWGYKILIILLLFVFAMTAMVVIAFQQSNEMIDSNYYEKEMLYQQQIDAATNLNQYHLDDIITTTNENLVVSILPKLTSNITEGKIEFIKPDDKKQDKELHFAPDQTGVYKIAKQTLGSGLFTVRLSWKSNGTAYYKQQNIFL